MKNTFVFVTNNNYLNHIRSLIGNLKRIGNWNKDFVVILSESISKVEVDEDSFKDRNIKLFNINKLIDPFYAKFYVFDEFLKNWDRVCYLDADFIIRKDVNSIFDQRGSFLIDQEEFEIWRYLSDRDLNVLNELKTWFNVDRLGYNTSCMLFDTSIINKDTINDLNLLKEKYQVINQHTGLPNGTDQPIINFMFYDRFNQIDAVGYVGRTKSTDIMNHTCRWGASWVLPELREYYNLGLKSFNEWN